MFNGKDSVCFEQLCSEHVVFGPGDLHVDPVEDIVCGSFHELWFSQDVLLQVAGEDPKEHNVQLAIWDVAAVALNEVLPLLELLAEVGRGARGEFLEAASARHLDEEATPLIFSEQPAPQFQTMIFLTTSHRDANLMEGRPNVVAEEWPQEVGEAYEVNGFAIQQGEGPHSSLGHRLVLLLDDLKDTEPATLRSHTVVSHTSCP